ncbi:hypothetical protein L208DRAFT_1392214 [Tricholoma matsutake]|nr:hypothetical protein L208DRAFT_1392214 [Tricholoma matsutake 945]
MSRQEADEDGKRQMAEGARVANHRDSHLKGARELLEKWRIEMWLDQYRRWPWGHHSFLSDVLITSFATKARFSLTEDLIDAGWSPTHAQKHGQELLGILKVYDNEFYRAREGEKLRKAERKKQETVE